MANARNSLPSAAERVRHGSRVQQRVERGRLSLPPSAAPSAFPSVASFVGHSGSTQGQLKLTAIYCISIMVSPSPSPLPPRPSPSSLLLHHRVFSSSRRRRRRRLHFPRTYVQHESCTVDLLRALWYTHRAREHAEVPYG